MDAIKCIYHANCDDGFTAAWIVGTKYPEIELIEGIYGNPPDIESLRNCIVFIVDFSYAPDIMLQIAQVATGVVWLDHHKTAIEAYNNFESLFPDNFYCLLDLNRSGAMLTWNHCYPGVIPSKLVYHVQDNDLWRFESENTKPFIANLRTFERTLNNWDWVESIVDEDDGYKSFVDEGKAVQRYLMNKVAETVAMCSSPCDIFGDRCYIANAPYSMASELCHALSQLPESKFGCSYYINAANKVVFSFRSTGDYDVSAIAKRLGGGGHKNAAGAVLPLEQALQYIRQ